MLKVLRALVDTGMTVEKAAVILKLDPEKFTQECAKYGVHG